MSAVLFDIDGTLLLSGYAGKSAMEASLAGRFGITDPVDGVPMNGRTDRAILRDLLLANGLEDSPENVRSLRAAYLEQLPAHLAERNGVELPGVRALLERLILRDDLSIGLLTGNMQAGAQLKLAHFGLVEYFAYGGFGDDHFERNAVAADALEATHRHHGAPVDPRRVWVIGDTPSDVACAKAVGARSVAVATGYCDADELAATDPDLLLDDLSDPGPLLRLIG